MALLASLGVLVTFLQAIHYTVFHLEPNQAPNMLDCLSCVIACATILMVPIIGHLWVWQNYVWMTWYMGRQHWRRSMRREGLYASIERTLSV